MYCFQIVNATSWQYNSEEEDHAGMATQNKNEKIMTMLISHSNTLSYSLSNMSNIYIRLLFLKE